MFNDDKTAERFVEDTYGITLKYDDEESVLVHDGAVLTEDGKVNYHGLKGGVYTHYDFQDSNHVIYKLVYFPDESIGNERLIENMQQEEWRDVKEWEELPQKEEEKNYIMYKLVPYTVQGLPTYS